MSLLTRRLSAFQYDGESMLGAVRTQDDVRVACPVGVPPAKAKDLFGDRIRVLQQVGRGLLATLSLEDEGDAAEPDLLRDRNVLFAVRNGETAEATTEWLQFHADHHGADAALILDRDPPSRASFAELLRPLLPDLPVVVVSTEHALGLPNGPDARDPALAPGATGRDLPPVDPWHAPLSEITVYDLLRHWFLSEARAIALLDIADVVRPEAGPLFARVASGKALPLQGIEAYPWRLRRDQPAPYGDHIAIRRNERRRLLSWAAAMVDVPRDSPIRPGRPPSGVTLGDPVSFVRAIGVVFPGAPVNALVRKSELVEDAGLVRFAKDVLGADPIRLPAPSLIPGRPGSNRVAIVTAMKNEGPFILDWIAHNRAIGVDTHLVYTNDCEDGTDRLLDALDDAGITRRDNPYRQTGKVPQYAAFRAAESEAMLKAADWLLTLDVDEYTNIHVGDGRLSDLFDAVPEAHVISMPWRLFGNADRHHFEDVPVTRQFTLAAPAYAPRPLQAWAFKSVFRNAGLFRRLGVHRPKGIERDVQSRLVWVDGSGREMPRAVWRSAWRMSKMTWGYDLVSVNHYAVRSAESFLVKRERGRVNHTTRDQDSTYWFRMNHNAEEELSIQRLATAVASEKSKLLSLPGVADLHAAAVEWHKARIATLMNDRAYADLYADITSERMQRLSRMASYFGHNVQLAGPHVIPDDVASRDPSVPFFFTVDEVPAQR